MIKHVILQFVAVHHAFAVKMDSLFDHFHDQRTSTQIDTIYCVTLETLKKYFSPEDLPDQVEAKFKTAAAALQKQEQRPKIWASKAARRAAKDDFLTNNEFYMTKDEFLTWACENDMEAVFEKEFWSFKKVLHWKGGQWQDIYHGDSKQWNYFLFQKEMA